MMTPGSNAWREKHWPRCGDADLVASTFTGGIRLAVARPAVEATDALFATMAAHGYAVRQKDTGTYNCRPITGGTAYSSHAYGIAVDVNWLTNPYVRHKLVTDMPLSMVEACHGIVTLDGRRVWRWGGDWDGRPDTPHTIYDAMHWEVILTPEELRAGIARTIDQPRIAAWPTLRRGSRGPAVVLLQETLDISPVGRFGPQTEKAVRAFQTKRGLLVDGIVGAGTWTALHWHLPEVRPGDTRPDKKIAA